MEIKTETKKNPAAKTHANLDMFASDLSQFKAERGNNTIERRAELLTSSGGRPIDAINECLESYNDLCDNLNKVYASTERYLEQALANLQRADLDSTLK